MPLDVSIDCTRRVAARWAYRKEDNMTTTYEMAPLHAGYMQTFLTWRRSGFAEKQPEKALLTVRSRQQWQKPIEIWSSSLSNRRS